MCKHEDRIYEEHLKKYPNEGKIQRTISINHKDGSKEYVGIYRGFSITALFGETLGGWDSTSYRVERESDEKEIEDNFYELPLDEALADIKYCIDKAYKEPDEWCYWECEECNN